MEQERSLSEAQINKARIDYVFTALESPRKVYH